MLDETLSQFVEDFLLLYKVTMTQKQVYLSSSVKWLNSLNFLCVLFYKEFKQTVFGVNLKLFNISNYTRQSVTATTFISCSKVKS